MFLRRVFFGRAFLAAARSESSAGNAAAAASATGHNPLEAFFEQDRSPDEETPVVYGRSWKASELRLKSWEDLHKLWYVLLKEKNMLMTQRQMLNAQNLRFPNPERLPKVRKSMCRIKHVLTERAIEEADLRRSSEMKRMINVSSDEDDGSLASSFLHERQRWLSREMTTMIKVCSDYLSFFFYRKEATARLPCNSQVT